MASGRGSTTNYSPDYVFDDFKGDDWSTAGKTRLWQSNVGRDHWIGYDFGAGNEKNIVQFGVWPRSAFADQKPKSAFLQFSDDGVNWKSKLSIPALNVGMLAKAPQTSRTHGAHRYWRLNMLRTIDNTAVAAGEVELRATYGGPDVTTPATPVTAYSRQSATYDATMASDDNLDTLYSAYKTTNAASWLAYDLGTPVEIVEVAVRSRSDGYTMTNPICFGVQYSDDGTDWTTAWTMNDPTPWDAATWRILRDEPPGVDRFYPGVVFASTYTGTAGARDITNGGYMATPVTKVGTPTVDETTALLAETAPSIRLDASSYLSLPHSESTTVATVDNVTMEMLFKPNNLTQTSALFNKRPSASAHEFALQVNTNGSVEFATFRNGVASLSILSASGSVVAGQTYHVALMRKNGVWYLFLNGAVVGTVTQSAIPTSSTSPLLIGRDGFSTARFLDGWVDEIRITREARYPISGFTPPTNRHV